MTPAETYSAKPVRKKSLTRRSIELLQWADRARGHAITAGAVLSLIGTLGWAVAGPKVEKWMDGRITAQGFASAKAVEELTETSKKQQEQLEGVGNDLDKARSEQLLLKQKIEDMSQLLKDQDIRQSRDMREIRRLLLQAR